MNLFGMHFDTYTTGIVMGGCFGITSRIMMLQTDYRQYPTYPHGKIIHISLSVIAAALGSVAVPSMLEKNYTAITFLSLAAQQFRDVRNMERQSLLQIDKEELVPRGSTYIEGIAMVFEGRNYLVILTALLTSLCCILFTWYYGLAAGAFSLILSHFYKQGKRLVDLTDIQIAPIRMEGPDLYVDHIYMMNVGLSDTQKLIKEHGLGLLITPKNMNVRSVVANLGQRQAILHDVSTILGVYRDSGEPSLMPIAKLDMNSGALAVFILPQDKEPERAIQAVNRVPVLESAVRMPSESAAMQGKGGVR
jgi:uncharacterized protein